jgi:hypothetical protein
MQHPKTNGFHDRRTLNTQEPFPCPICRHGQIEALTLMDAFACNFCRHIFTTNLKEQTVHVEDSSQPMTWRWNGRKWQTANETDLDLSIVIWLVAIALVVLPPSLIWLPSQIFVPLDGGSGDWFPLFWICGLADGRTLPTPILCGRQGENSPLVGAIFVIKNPSCNCSLGNR